MTLHLYLLRHGETTYSRTGGFCGDLDPPLTPAGERMAAAFAQKHAHLPWQAVYTSPLQRALSTAEPLCTALGITPQVRPGLREIAYGAWEGKTAAAVQAEYPQDYLRWLAEPAWNPPTAGETAVEIAIRADQVINEIQQQHRQGAVLIVSHKATLRIILCSLLGIDLGRYRDRIDMPAASVSLVRFAEHGPLLQLLGDRSHFSEELLALPGT